MSEKLFNLVDAAYAEDYPGDLDAPYHALLLHAAAALQNATPEEAVRLSLYTALNQLPYFRPMTLPPAGRALYGTLHVLYRDIDAKKLRHAALGYGLIAASGTWLS
ncbi:bacteriocin immunity protein [Lacticaseibacillus daqingensis]|uniref:bacteriocin immunity protein n=1 Tax=Lacticaseibacillus daqingensis TaxID=2486014 RepID=UPI000F78B573|nr:bacteriocin immunity protein [Lacticaseibacillus daqingensis]